MEINLLLPSRERSQPSCEFDWTGVVSGDEILRFVSSTEAAYASLQGTAELCIDDYGLSALILFTALDGIGHFVIGGKFTQGYSTYETCEDSGRLSAFRNEIGTAVYMFDGLVIDQSYLPQVIGFFRGVLQQITE